jgi:aspartate carbamoyltransferase catalytic subunit
VNTLRHMLDFGSLNDEEWDSLCREADKIRQNPAAYASARQGAVLATLFFEPSTRTQLSFQTAMLRLGGSVIGFSDPGCSSVAKGESLRDTVKIVGTYADVIVIRSPLEGSAYAASLYSPVPVINAGDGGHLHPTQTMTDLYTLRRELGRCDGLKIGVCGDLYYGRTVHSLLSALARYKGNKFYLISTDSLRIPEYCARELKDSGAEFYEVKTIEECIGELDVLYMTRVQRERFASAEEYQRQAGVYVLTTDKLRHAKSDLVILHPLPKVDEIAPEIDDDPRAKYFAQAENGLYIRMALILWLTENMEHANRKPIHSAYPIPAERICRNPRCVTSREKYLPALAVGDRCAFCAHLVG